MFDPTLPELYARLGLMPLDDFIRRADSSNRRIGATTWMLVTGLHHLLQGKNVKFVMETPQHIELAEADFVRLAESMGLQRKWWSNTASFAEYTNGAGVLFIPPKSISAGVRYEVVLVDTEWKERALRRAKGWEHMAVEARLVGSTWEVFAEDDEFLFAIQNADDLTTLTELNKSVRIVVPPAKGVTGSGENAHEPGRSHQSLPIVPPVCHPNPARRGKRPRQRPGSSGGGSSGAG